MSAAQTPPPPGHGADHVSAARARQRLTAAPSRPGDGMAASIAGALDTHGRRTSGGGRKARGLPRMQG